MTTQEKALAQAFADSRKKNLEEGITPVVAALRAKDVLASVALIQSAMVTTFPPVRTSMKALIKLQPAMSARANTPPPLPVLRRPRWCRSARSPAACWPVWQSVFPDQRHCPRVGRSTARGQQRGRRRPYRADPHRVERRNRPVADGAAKDQSGPGLDRIRSARRHRHDCHGLWRNRRRQPGSIEPYRAASQFDGRNDLDRQAERRQRAPANRGAALRSSPPKCATWPSVRRQPPRKTRR